jgi:hypothetical protein
MPEYDKMGVCAVSAILPPYLHPLSFAFEGKRYQSEFPFSILPIPLCPAIRLQPTSKVAARVTAHSVSVCKINQEEH